MSPDCKSTLQIHPSRRPQMRNVMLSVVISVCFSESIITKQCRLASYHQFKTHSFHLLAENANCLSGTSMEGCKSYKATAVTPASHLFSSQVSFSLQGLTVVSKICTQREFTSSADVFNTYMISKSAKTFIKKDLMICYLFWFIEFRN
jgi:hypothetical protein